MNDSGYDNRVTSLSGRDRTIHCFECQHNRLKCLVSALQRRSCFFFFFFCVAVLALETNREVGNMLKGSTVGVGAESLFQESFKGRVTSNKSNGILLVVEQTIFSHDGSHLLGGRKLNIHVSIVPSTRQHSGLRLDGLGGSQAEERTRRSCCDSRSVDGLATQEGGRINSEGLNQFTVLITKDVGKSAHPSILQNTLARVL
mmetsp:Transcript_21369/g.36398  ORF Transcript_21369/g.36398 Transcript_21369/m.36398 type:complete len:201 (+) Transcript_21369:521-1123(+)